MPHILLIEDDAQFRTMIAMMLLHEGHQVATSNDGAEGLQYYFQNWPDLIISDILMPRKDGLAVITAIRENNPYTPIIAMSGGNKDSTKESCVSQAKLLGANCILIKPFQLAELRKAINDVLEK